MGVPDPLGILLPRLRDALEPLTRMGVAWAPTIAPIPTDGTDTIMHSGREHGSRAMIKHDSGHSTTTTPIPLQRRGNGNYHLTHSLRKSERTGHPSLMVQKHTG
jgi:hypothetical protein